MCPSRFNVADLKEETEMIAIKHVNMFIAALVQVYKANIKFFLASGLC